MNEKITQLASMLEKFSLIFPVIESCKMNKLSPGWYVKELVSRLTAKPCSDVEKVAILPCFIQK